ncbi:MAG: WhiB family transcriptional regulator [Actinomycetota bacterium]|nr:WhiB family transcriptional regulator [Actinomycetota bacterium]
MTLNSLIDESRLVTLVNDPRTPVRRWHDRAACAELPLAEDAYFPEDGELPPTEALARCVTCAVAHECLATALIHESEEGLRFGWWGGCGPDEREVLAEHIGLATTQVEIDLRRPADLARILRAQNCTIASIAAELGCTERTVYRYLATTAA